jgi:hypothetical protein
MKNPRNKRRYEQGGIKERLGEGIAERKKNAYVGVLVFEAQ